MLDAGGGGGIVASAKMFAKAASEGSFAVNETGGRALLAAIREMRKWITSQDLRLATLQQAAPLGGSEGARTMQPYLQQVASDQQGFITMLREFGESLDQAEQGIEAAMASYQEMDAGIGARFPTQA
jgi:hypothetical protein